MSLARWRHAAHRARAVPRARVTGGQRAWAWACIALAAVSLRCERRSDLDPTPRPTSAVVSAPPLDATQHGVELTGQGPPPPGSASVGKIILDNWERARWAKLLAQLPAPSEACIPASSAELAHARGLDSGDCVYELTPHQLYDPSRCEPDALLDRLRPSRYCVEGVGSYFGRLVRLRDVALTISEDFDPTCPAVANKPCTATSSPCCMGMDQRYPCFGRWWGSVGVASGDRVIPLASASGDQDITCGRGWNARRTFVPDRGTGRHRHCQPICPSWVWQRQTLIVRPTAAGLRLVLPPSGIDARYLQP